jgi:uncharacterized membrane protein
VKERGKIIAKAIIKHKSFFIFVLLRNILIYSITRHKKIQEIYNKSREQFSGRKADTEALCKERRSKNAIKNEKYRGIFKYILTFGDKIVKLIVQ